MELELKFPISEKKKPTNFTADQKAFLIPTILIYQIL